MYKIKIKKPNQDESISIELDSGTELLIDLTVNAKVVDNGIGPFEHHGYQGVHSELNWEITSWEVHRVDVYLSDFDVFVKVDNDQVLKKVDEILSLADIEIQTRAERYQDED